MDNVFFFKFECVKPWGYVYIYIYIYIYNENDLYLS